MNQTISALGINLIDPDINGEILRFGRHDESLRDVR